MSDDQAMLSLLGFFGGFAVTAMALTVMGAIAGFPIVPEWLGAIMLALLPCGAITGAVLGYKSAGRR